MTGILVVGLLVLLFLGLPLYVALFGISATLFASSSSMSLWSTTISFQKLQGQEFLSAIPLFTFAGYLMARGQSPVRVVNLFRAAFGFLRGADAGIVVAIMALFTALGGASPVAIIALGGLMLPLLIGSGKTERFSLGLITTSGSIGLLFAPSLPVIIYAIIASQNQTQVEINTLFRAALLPSALMIGGVILYSAFQKNRRDAKPRESFSWKRLGEAMWAAKWEIPIPFMVYGGIYSGTVTVLEAAAITAGYVFVMEFFLTRDLTLRKDFVAATLESMKLSGSIFIIMATALILSNYLILEEIPKKLFTAIHPVIKSPYGFLFVVNILLLIAGSLLEIFSAILIMLPILLPMVQEYGINPYHFAIIFLVNMEIGYLLPPVGINLFISAFRFKKPITQVYRATAPFLAILAALLLIITYVPGVSTFGLPKEKAKTNVLTAPVGVTTVPVGTNHAGTNQSAETEKFVALVGSPDAVAAFTLEARGPDKVAVKFKAPGLDGGKGRASKYEVKYLDQQIEKADDFEFANDFEVTVKPADPGKEEEILVSGLAAGKTWWFGIRALDQTGRAGGWSPIVKIQIP